MKEALRHLATRISTAAGAWVSRNAEDTNRCPVCHGEVIPPQYRYCSDEHARQAHEAAVRKR